MAKTKHNQEHLKDLAKLIATSRMEDKDKYPEFFNKKFYGDIDFKVRDWEDDGILFTPVVNLFGESSFVHQEGDRYVEVKCTSLYLGFLFYGIVIRLGFKYVPVENFQEEVQYHDDYWEVYDTYMENFTKDDVQEPVKKQPKKKEIKKDSTKFVNKKNTKSTKPKKNGKV